MRQNSLIILVLLGSLLVLAGTLEFPREVEIMTLSLKAFGGILALLFGLWEVVCAFGMQKLLPLENLETVKTTSPFSS